MEQAVEKQSQGMGLTPYEMQIICDVLNARTNVPGNIRDLKLIQNTVKSILDQTPAKPDRPVFRKLAEGESYPKEELEVLQAQQEKFFEDLKTHMHGTEVTVELSNVASLLIKQRLQTFHSFQTDEETRQRVIKLAEKFGL